MESLFSHRPYRSRQVLLAAALAIGIEGSTVVLATRWPSPKGAPVPPVPTDVTFDPSGPPLFQPLLAPLHQPVPSPADLRNPPPEGPALPDDAPPPAVDGPGMEAPLPLERVRTGSRPPKTGVRVKHSGHPQTTGIAALPQTQAVAGISGSGITGSAGGWHKPKPPYPAVARSLHIEGSGSVRVTTGVTGHVISVVVIQSAGNSLLDFNTITYVRANWSGPPNSTLVLPITYLLQ